MDGEEIIDEFSGKYQDQYKEWTVTLTIKKLSETTRGLLLGSKGHNNFFGPFSGANPVELYFSVREENGIRYMFIDEYRPTDTDNLIKFLHRNSKNKNNTHSASRTIYYGGFTPIVPIAIQVIQLMPEILNHKKTVLKRKQIIGEPTRVRWQAVLV